MTESQWLSSTNPHEMLAFLKDRKPVGLASFLSWFGLAAGRSSTRKCRLFACACCRRLGPLLADERSRQAIEIAELYAEGLVSKKAFQQAVQAARVASLQAARPRVMMGEWLAAAQSRAAEAIACTLEADDPADEAATWGKEAIRAWAAQNTRPYPAALGHMPQLPHRATTPEAAWIAEGIAQCDLLREVIGNPFRAPVLLPSWRTPEATALATRICQDRAFADMPQLASLLEQAGCNNPEILQHCRETKEHARGCWALDFILGKR
jgi:hypothetical protein